MIITKATWTRRPKQYRTIWWHEWHGVPFEQDPRVQSGHVESSEYQPNHYRAAVYSYAVRTDVGEFDDLGTAQAACDALCAERLGTTLAEAAANWKTWTKQRRAAAKAAREARQRESEARMTPEARERSRQLADALTGGRR